MTGRILLLNCLTLLVLHGSISAQQARATTYTPTEQMRNYALSVCLANAYPNSPESKDAAAAASAYIEQGSGPLQAYPAIINLAKRFLARPYQSQSNAALQVMKCIDLYHSPDLTRLIHKYTDSLNKPHSR